MGLRKRILCEEPTEKPTKEDQERYELAWRILCEKGSVCVTDPLNTKDESVEDILKHDPNAFTGPFCDYHGDIPLSEYRRSVINKKKGK